MCIHLSRRAWDCKVGPTAKVILVLLADMANAKNDNCCWPSIEHIIEKTELSERTVQAKLNELEKAGHITRILRSGQSTKYRVHPRNSRTPVTPAGVREMHQIPASESENPRESCGETRKNLKRNTSAAPIGQILGGILSEAASNQTGRSGGGSVTAAEMNRLIQSLGND